MATPIQTLGSPAWMTTFADLMSLMMTFFVLMFAMSETDVAKYRAIAGSLAEAFGGAQLDDRETRMLRGIAAAESRDGAQGTPAEPAEPAESAAQEARGSAPPPDQVLLERLQAGLVDELAAERLIVERHERKVIVRFPEHISFRSGRDELVPEAVPLVRKVVGLLGADAVRITVAGHTDDRPISTQRFRSNWDLSAARAVSVAEQVLAGGIDSGRLVVSGHADTQSLEPNATEDGRARNRRVEIVVEYPAPADAGADAAADPPPA
ncbi:MAG: OmpA family protein [Gammaproteobacteria bacterium]|nr:OmpA family protein [Gammaproteobacteria bacterium]